MAEMKLEILFVTTASEAIKSLPAVAILHRRMHRILSGAASAFGEECSLDRAAAPCFGFKHESN
jgi:hypothetical protein